MPFQRSDYYGENFNCYAVDSVGYIAQFTTGFGPMPQKIFTNEDAYNCVSNYFRLSGTSFCTSSLSTWAKVQQERGIGYYSSCMEEACMGLFIFDEEDYEPIHRLYAVPDKPLHVTSLPDNVQDFIALLKFSKVKFTDSDVIDVSKYFECFT